MSASAAEIHFAAEFVTFLAAAVGLAVVLLRGDLLTSDRTRVPMGAGFLLLAASAFLHGSLLLDDGDRPLLFALRALGVVGIGLGASRWAGPPQGKRLVWLGTAVLALAAVLGLSTSAIATSALLAAGGLAVGAAVVLASRRSVASLVAASSAITLLLVVLVLAIGISAVLSSTVENQARDRLATRAVSEAKFVADQSRVRIVEAGVTADALRAGREQALRTATDQASANVISQALFTVSQQYLNGRPMAYIAVPSQKAVATTPGFPGNAVTLAGSPAVKETLTQNHRVGSVQLVGDQLLVVGAAPVRDTVNGVTQVIGVVVTVSPIDRGYFQTRVEGEADLGAALATPTGYLASFAQRPPFSAVQPLVRSVLAAGTGRRTGETSARFFAVAPVLASDNRPVAALVMSQPTTVVAQTRDELYRVLFLIALGGTLAALALAALVGNRVGAGLRRLTIAAGSIQGGDLAARVDIVSEDEVGLLGAAFDSMAQSIQDKTGELRGARNRLEAVVAGMGEALVATDADGLVTDFNRSAEELLGVSAAEVKGRRVEDILTVRADDGSSLADRLGKPTPRRWSIDGTLRGADGDDIPVSLSAGALRGLEDELAGSVYVLRDLRREREVERMKTEFLSRIGHELRTPLTGITGYAELLTRKQVPPDRARQWHEEILKQSRALLRIVQMLEFFASTGAGRVMLRPHTVDLRHVIDDVVTRHGAKLNGHKLTRRVARGVPKLVADERWLTQSLDELVDNAVKFSPDGGRVVITAATADNGRVEIAVTDSGKGMTREEQALAFAEFVQGDTSDTRQFGGLGLGLSLVQRVAEAHGGSVSCVSAPGKGSKFSIFLPVLPIED